MKQQYPLLTAWFNNDLRAAWIAERDALKREDPKLLPFVLDHEGAARTAAHLSQEMERLATDVWRLRNQHRLDAVPYTDEVIEFYDELRSPLRKSYRHEIFLAISAEMGMFGSTRNDI